MTRLREDAEHLDGQRGSLAPQDDVTVIVLDVTDEGHPSTSIPFS